MSREPIDVRNNDTKLFSFIAIETSAKCNRRCAFCPVSHAPRPDEYMSDEMFEKIVSDLESIKYRGRVALYSYNEPVRDERLRTFISEIRSRLPRTCIMINSNGDYFKSADDIAALYHAGLNQMQINIYNAADGCGDREKIDRGIEKAKKRYELIKGWVDSIYWLDQEISLYQHIGASKTACQVVPKWDFQPNDMRLGENDMPTRKHGISVRHHISNRAGNIPDFADSATEPLGKMCIRPFRAMTINWRGDTMLCCNDYYAEASSGNVMERSLTELWNDPRWHAYRIKLLARDRRIHLCDKCDYAGGFYQHNVQSVTMGREKDVEIINADMRSAETAGFAASPLLQLRVKK